MTNEDLLKRAIVFNAGPPPTVNQYVLDEDDDSQGHDMTIEYRGQSGWAICVGRSCVNKITGELEYEAYSSDRTDEFIANTRFPTPQEAFEFLWEWKANKREDARHNSIYIRWKDFIRHEP
jgi:hypothetical protein